MCSKRLSTSFFNTGSTTLRTSDTSPTELMMTVPGDITCSPFLYFWVIDRESLPVGTLIPRSTTKSLKVSTAAYKRASSPGFLQGHIQLTLRLTPFRSEERRVGKEW